MKYFCPKTKQKLRLAPHLYPAKSNIWLKIGSLGRTAKSSAILWGLTAAFLLANSLVPKTLFAQEKLEIKDFDYWGNLCKLLGDEKKYEEAIAACNQGIAIKPDEAEIWITRTQILLKQAKYSEALVSADRILRLQPKYSLALAQRCEALLSLGKYVEAIAACDLALRSDGNWGDNTAVVAWYNKGLAQTKLGQFTEAIAAFNRVLIINPENSLALTGNCQALTNLNRFSEAISACDAAIKTNNNWGDNSPAIAWYTKGLAQKKNGQLQAAIAAFDQAIAMNPQDAEIWLEHGRTLAMIGKPEQAAVSYEFAVKLSPKYALALASQSAAFNKLNKFQEAQTAAEQALQGDNRWGDVSPALAWEQRGIALAGLGNYEEGLASLERAIALNPNYAEAWNNRAVTQWYLGRYSDAIASSDRSTQINPKYAQAWFNKGRILKTLARYHEALAAYSKALENTGKFTDKLLLANIWANRSVVLWHLSRNQEALVSADRAISLNPELSQGWYNRGVVLFDLARYNEAINAYNRANTLAPTDANILAGKGVALLKLGNFQEAVTTFTTTLQLDPKNTLALANQIIAQKRLQEQQQKMPVIPDSSKMP